MHWRVASQEIANAFFPVDPDWSRKDFVDETCERNNREILDHPELRKEAER
jgi:hypothetical protein